MNPYADSRTNERYDHSSTAMFNVKAPEAYFYGQMNNYSSEGMGFESSLAIKPGTNIEIYLNRPPFKASPKKYKASVRWCNRQIVDDSFYTYKIGVKYL